MADLKPVYAVRSRLPDGVWVYAPRGMASYPTTNTPKLWVRRADAEAFARYMSTPGDRWRVVEFSLVPTDTARSAG